MSVKLAATHETGALEPRKAFCNTLLEMAKEDERICVLDADLMNAAGTKPFKQAYPERTFDCGVTTLNNAVGALLDMFKNSPIGEELEQGLNYEKKRLRHSYDDLSAEALAYSLYVYGEKNDTLEFRVSDLFQPSVKCGPHIEFGISKNAILKKLRFLSSESNRVLIAELNMGLDHITLTKDKERIRIACIS